MKLLETDPKLIELMQQIQAARTENKLPQMKQLCFRLRRTAGLKQAKFALCYAECMLASYYSNILDTKRCFRQLARALAMCEAGDYDELALFTNNLYGIAYSANGEGSVAIDYYLTGLELAVKHRNYEYQAKIYVNIGDSFLRLGQYASALRYMQKALTVLRNHPNTDSAAYINEVALANLMEIYCNLDEPHKALEIAKRNEADGIQRASSTVDVLKGVALEKAGEWEAAQELFRAFELRAGGLGDRELYADSMLKITRASIEAGDEAYSRHCMEDMTAHGPYDSPDITMRLSEMRILLHRTFGSVDELSQAYAEFYECFTANRRVTEREKAQSIYNRISLRHSQQKNVEMQKSNKQLKDISGVDELSRLPNRRALNEKLERELTANCGGGALGVIVSDIDHFKDFNDKYGHLVGDKVLRLVANCLVDEDERFFASRFGGDEFITVCSGCAERDIAEYIERCFMRLRLAQLELSEDIAPVTISSGYYFAKPDGTLKAETLILHADQALYEAKCRSRNCYVAYTELFG